MISIANLLFSLRQTSVRRIVVFNFFDGILHRGIPLYSRGVSECFRRLGIDVIEVTCPRPLRRLPKPVLNLLFVFFEQVVSPLVRLLTRAAFTLYPYNSAGVLDALADSGLVVVHDLIAGSRGSGGLAAAYIRGTQRFHGALGRPFCAASEITARQMRRGKRFIDKTIPVWPNPFYAFETAAHRFAWLQETCARADCGRILLCSGSGRNKDFRGAIRLFMSSRALSACELRVVGFGDNAPLARRLINRSPCAKQNRITILGKLSLDELLEEYFSAGVVWVHSVREGFGRSVVEARICGRPVLAANISAFRRFRSAHVQLYSVQTFEAAAERSIRGADVGELSTTADNFHRDLEESIEAFIRSRVSSS